MFWLLRRWKGREAADEGTGTWGKVEGVYTGGKLIAYWLNHHKAICHPQTGISRTLANNAQSL